MFVRKAGLDIGDLALRLGRPEQIGEHRQRLLLAAAADQVTRALGYEEQRDQEHYRGDRLGEIHPAPGLDPGEFAKRIARRLRNEIIDHERGRQPGDDHHLLHRGQPPANMRGGDLGDVERGKHRSRAHRHAAAEPGDHEKPVQMGQALSQRPGDEQRGGDQHHVAAPDHIGQPPGEERADRATDQQRADRETQFGCAQVEFGCQAGLGAVDRAAVVTEQEAADGRDRDDCGNQRHVDAAARLYAHLSLSPRALP